MAEKPKTEEFKIAGMTVKHVEGDKCSELMFFPPKEDQFFFGKTKVTPSKLFDIIVAELNAAGYGCAVSSDGMPSEENDYSMGRIGYDLTQPPENKHKELDYDAVSVVLSELVKGINSKHFEEQASVALSPEELKKLEDELRDTLPVPPKKETVEEWVARLRAEGKEIAAEPVLCKEKKKMIPPFGGEEVDVEVHRSR